MPGCVATHISKRSGGKDSPFPFYPSSWQPFPIRPIHRRDSPRRAPDPPQENGHRQAWQRQHHRHLHYQPAVLLPLAFSPRHPRARQRHSSPWPSSYPSCQPAPYSTYHHHHHHHHHHRLFCRLRRHHCCHPLLHPLQHHHQHRHRRHCCPRHRWARRLHRPSSCPRRLNRPKTQKSASSSSSCPCAHARQWQSKSQSQGTYFGQTMS
ncbi:uncharacterized protein IWZ02DRAFT_31029 [Phyllosticta citriasiana]|uniref:uncharacterized protein n=1 Tax=Phyllosticta citriasiana TaxID=595635 RepID=UPI0030FDD88C